MYTTARRIVLAAAMLVCGGWGAKASFVITFLQDGADVYGIGAGNLNFDDLDFVGVDLGPNFVDAGGGAVLLGPVPSVYATVYAGPFSGPASFGSGGLSFASSGASFAPGGTGAGIDGAAGRLFLPGGYASNAPLTVYSVWKGRTIRDLGLETGSYTWTWGP